MHDIRKRGDRKEKIRKNIRNIDFLGERVKKCR
jgi:hypothetical protein